MKATRRGIILFLVLLCTGCNTRTTQKTVLHVALYPYIPDAGGDRFKALADRIKKEFETNNPSIKLVLDPIDPGSGGFYDLGTLKTWLTADPLSAGYHVVEVDAILLGDLVQSSLVTPWFLPPGQDDWQPAGRTAVYMNGRAYGVPHWMCGHFVFSRDDAVARAKTIGELTMALHHADPNVSRLAGDLRGSWNLPAVYLDAWASTYGTERVASAISTQLDFSVIKSLNAFAAECKQHKMNPCVDGTYHNNNVAAENFANGKVDAMFGYSERLHYVLKRSPSSNNIKLSYLPLGNGNHPILFVDAFVLRRDCDEPCQEAASAFAAYMNAPQTFEWIAMSRDAGPHAVPRYLMPATLSAYREPTLRQDRYYQALESETRNAASYPNAGLYRMHEEMHKLIEAKLEK